MSNFICPTCGMNNIDCGTAGYKTDKEIELEKENARLKNELSEHKENCCCLKNEALRLENAKLKESLGIAIKALYDVQTWLTCNPDDIKELIPDFCAEQKALETANTAIEKIIYRRQPDTSKPPRT